MSDAAIGFEHLDLCADEAINIAVVENLAPRIAHLEPSAHVPPRTARRTRRRRRDHAHPSAFQEPETIPVVCDG